MDQSAYRMFVDGKVLVRDVTYKKAVQLYHKYGNLKGITFDPPIGPFLPRVDFPSLGAS